MQNRSQQLKPLSLIPSLISDKAIFDRSNIAELFFLLSGVAMMAILAQVALPLPFTPVPITGQSFGILLVALMWGARRGAAVLALYVFLGSLGMPIFAKAASGFFFGPSYGYLLAMPVAGFVVGSLVDRYSAKNFLLNILFSFIGLSIVFAGGLFVLSYYVGNAQVLALGLYPFLVGAIVKIISASLLASGCSRLRS